MCVTSRPQCLQRRFEPLCQRCVVLCGFPGMGLCVAAIHLKTASPKPRNESRPHVSVDFTFRVSAAATSRSFFLSPPFPLSFAGTKFSTYVRTSTYTRPCSNFDHLSLISFGPSSIMASSSGAAAAAASAVATALARAMGNLMNEHESNASLDIDEAVIRGGHGSSSGSGSRSGIAAGSAGLMRSRGSRREDNPPRGSRRRSSSRDAIARVIGKLMNSDQSLIDEDVVEKGETNALISEYVNPGGTAPEERGKDVTNEERNSDGQLENGRRKSEPNLVVLNDVNFGDDDGSADRDAGAQVRRGRRRSRSSDRSIDILESFDGQDQPVELTSRAAVDNCKEGAVSSASSRGRDRQSRQSRRGSAGGDDREIPQSRRRSGSIDAINRVIKAVGVKSFEFVETDAADERPVMERKSSAKLE